LSPPAVLFRPLLSLSLLTTVGAEGLEPPTCSL
jgi:hypothetical protein